MISNGAYFKANPDKILGTYYTHNPNTGRELTDQFNNPRPEVWGSIEDIKKIDTPEVDRYDHFYEGLPVVENPKENSSKNKIAQAITKSEEKSTDNKTQDLAKTILQYNQKVEYKDENGKTRYYNISEEEIQVWVTYQLNRSLFSASTIGQNAWGNYILSDPDWKAWQQKGLVAYDGRNYIPSPIYYAGNIYDKIKKLKAREAEIVKTIGQTEYDQQLKKLQAAKPKPLLISEDPKQKLYLSPFDKIWDDVEIKELTDGQEVAETSIGSIFYFNYLKNLGDEAFKVDNKRSSAYEVYYYWVRKDNFPRGTDPDRKAAIKRNTTIIGQKLFDRFLLEMLTRDDKNKIVALWNSTRNNYKAIDYYKIPIGFERINNRFKGGTLSIRPAQREGVAFMNSRGTGIIAYDVGVGKTMTSILGIDDAFSKGLFKRPLVVVPQKVYKKWIAEINGVKAEKDIYQGKGKKKKKIHSKGEIISEGILPNVKVNDYDNLGVSYISRARDENGVAIPVDAYSITMVTFEGLSKIGFNTNTEKTLAKRLNEALSQGESGRAAAIQNEKMNEWIDQTLAKTEIDIEQMGIDAIIVDEAHNFRNLFMDVKGDIGKDGERESKNFFSQTGSKPSGRALSLFMLNAYIQDKHKRRNTFGLTATPFTNRATEIYSMLSLYDYEGMKDFDCYNIAQFCTTYIDETMEDSWTAAGKFEPKAVIRGYNNLPTLQSMIYRSINYKTGEDANIQRPQKVILPLSHDENGIPLDFEHIIDTKLKPSKLQQVWLDDITLFASKDRSQRRESSLSAYYSEDAKGNIPGQTLIALNASRSVTFSPYTIKFGGEAKFDQAQVSPEQFIKGSPKIQYAVECIRSVVDYHKKQGTSISGQVIYSDRGKEWFNHIKDYLIESVGLKAEQVEVFHGGVSKGKRERIKEDFLSGKVKVIIGSSTMREGVDLQKYGSTMYICYIDWNPTDVHQLYGRIWRFGNQFSHVRLVVPLIENSSDIFTWQKLSEKMSRLNSIWTRADGTKLFEESELNAEELKKGLINDPKKIAEYEIEEAVSSLRSELSIVDGKLKELQQVSNYINELDELTASLEKTAKQAISNPSVQYGTEQKKIDALKSRTIIDQASIYRIVREYAKLKGYERWRMQGKVDSHIKLVKKLQRLEDNILVAYELTVRDDLAPVVNQIQEQKNTLEGQLEQVKSEDNLARLIEKHELEKAQQQGNSRTVEQRVAEFQRLNYLLDCQFGIHNCDIYGRVEEIKTGKQQDIVIQERPSIEAEYELPDILKRFIPKKQLKAVEELMLEEGYVESVLVPLEKQVKAIPKRQSGKPAIVHAHFFIGGTDWFITEWDGKDQLFGHTILNGDVQMSELGYISLNELRSISMKPLGFGVELDFFWQEKPLDQALYEYDKSYFPKPKNTAPSPQKETPKPEVQLVDKINVALKGLETLAQLQRKKTIKDKINTAIRGLKTLQQLKKAA